MNYHRYLSKDIIRQIKTSRRRLSILFTDIEGSTSYWDSRGDINGRLMVDQHNRLIFPALKKYHGKVIKTIGDAIMASFKKPHQALEAAIAIQQLLAAERKNNKYFTLKVRIGIHTGKALVEHNDIFGNVVNIAARVEGLGKGNDILVSGSTAMKLSRKKYRLLRPRQFTPRGRRKKMVVYRCEWQKLPDYSDKIKLVPLLPVIPRQKINILAYIIAAIGVLYFLYIRYFRYLLADSESIAIMALNPTSLFYQHPANWAIFLIVIISFLLLLVRIRRIPILLLKMIKGGFGFCLFFILSYLLLMNVQLDSVLRQNKRLYESDHLFVHVVVDGAEIFESPSLDSETIRTLNRGILLLLSDVKRHQNMVWNKVLIDKNNYGWILRVKPARMGIPAQRISLTSKFYFRLMDVYALAVGIIGFLWGYWSFKIRPA
jgi:class 3 adenylate cyclase